jgi:hypothetical protein
VRKTVFACLIPPGKIIKKLAGEKSGLGCQIIIFSAISVFLAASLRKLSCLILPALAAEFLSSGLHFALIHVKITIPFNAEVAELADALDSKSSGVTLHAGSSPAFGTR